MGQLVASTIPNLISGVSQQPWAVRLEAQAEEQINCYSSVTDFLKRRPATNHIARITDNLDHGAAVHYINRDTDEKYLCLFSDSDIQVFDLEGNQKEVEISDSGEAYLGMTNDPQGDLRFLTINDYTFAVNTQVTVETSEETTPVRDPEALVFVMQASYNTTYYVTVDGVEAEFTTLDGVAPADEPADELSSKEIIEELASFFDTTIYDIETKNSTMWIKRKDGGELSVAVEDTRSNTHITCFQTQVQTFSELPTVCPRDYVIEVIGDSSSSFDNYFCKFVPTDDDVDYGEGVWYETVKPDITYKLNTSTMPHALVRQADGTFTFDVIDWAERGCGDEDSAPWPSFVDRKINGVFFYRNRLSFLAEENVIMSETGEFFNFFVTTVTTMIDSDLIDVAASSIKNSTLYHAAVFSGGLLLFSDQTQYTLEHDTVLSNSTVSISPVTEFEASIDVAPVSAGKTVFFGTKRGEYGGIREYMCINDNTEQNDALDVTSHVPHYVGGSITNFACSTNEDLLLVLSAKDKTSIWTYKYFWNGTEKIQSSWGRWQMGGDVLGIVFIETDIYILIQYPEGVYLEILHVEPDYKDEDEDFEYCLDRKTTESFFDTITYDIQTKQSTLTSSLVIPDDCVIVTRGKETGGRPYTITEQLDNTITVRGDIRDVSFYMGVPYSSLYGFSTFALRDSEKGSAITTGRLQLRNLTLTCSNTGYIELHITPHFRDTNVYKYTGKELGLGSNILGAFTLYTGDIRCPLLSRNTQVTVEAFSDSYLPFSLVSATWEGLYNARHQRV